MITMEMAVVCRVVDRVVVAVVVAAAAASYAVALQRQTRSHDRDSLADACIVSYEGGSLRGRAGTDVVGGLGAWRDG